MELTGTQENQNAGDGGHAEARTSGALMNDPPPPYRIIAKALLDGEVVPFLGAGVNFGVLPIGTQLSRSLAEECNFPSTNDSDLEDLAKVSSYFVEVGSRLYLRRYLRQTFCRAVTPHAVAGAAGQTAEQAAAQNDGQVSDIHHYLARLDRPQLIVTTNYDDLTEASFRAAGRPYDLVIHPTDRKEWEGSVLWWEDMGLNAEADARKKPKAVIPGKLQIDLERKTVIYKMHGTVNRQRSGWDSYVITEDDYVEFLVRMTGQTAVPAQFMRHFQSCRFLFLGYGLRDWNFRVALRNLRTFLPVRKDGKVREGKDGAGGASALLAELDEVNPALAESVRQRIITPAQAVKILEITELQAAIAKGGVDPDELASRAADEDDDDYDDGGDLGPSWAVQHNPTALERRLWERRGIDIYNVDIKAFVSQLGQATKHVLKSR